MNGSANKQRKYLVVNRSGVNKKYADPGEESGDVLAD
jgi:hypothetical protein